MNRLKSLRKSAGLTLREVGTATGLPHTNISLIENGKRPLRQVHIEALCKFFHVTTDYLLGNSDYGFIVELGKFDTFTILKEKEYNEWKAEGKIKEYFEAKQLWRVPNDDLEKMLSPTASQELKEKIILELNLMSETKLDKVYKFIKDFL